MKAENTINSFLYNLNNIQNSLTPRYFVNGAKWYDGS